MSAFLPSEACGWWSRVYPGLAPQEQRNTLHDLASHARDPTVQARLVAAGIHSFVVGALRSAIPEPAGPAAAECWHVQAQAARLLANLAYLQESKAAVFGAGAAEALESAARVAISAHDREAAATRAVGTASGGGEAAVSLLIEACAALANLGSGPSLRARCLEPDCTLLPLLLRLARLRPDIGSEAVRAISNLACTPATRHRLCDLNAPRLLLKLLATCVTPNTAGGHLQPTAAWFTAAGWDVSILVGGRTLACECDSCCAGGRLAGAARATHQEHTGGGLGGSAAGSGGGASILAEEQDCDLPPDALDCPDSTVDTLCDGDPPAAKLVEKVLAALSCFLASDAQPPEWATPELPTTIVALITPRGLFSPWPSGAGGDGCGAARVRVSLEALRLSHRLVLTCPSLGVSLVEAGIVRALTAVLRANPPALLAGTVADVVFRALLVQPATRAATLVSPWLPPLLLATALVDTRAGAKTATCACADTGARFDPRGKADSALGTSPTASDDGAARFKGFPLLLARGHSGNPLAPAVESLRAGEPPTRDQQTGRRPGSAPLRSFRRSSGEGGSSPASCTRGGSAEESGERVHSPSGLATEQGGGLGMCAGTRVEYTDGVLGRVGAAADTLQQALPAPGATPPWPRACPVSVDGDTSDGSRKAEGGVSSGANAIETAGMQAQMRELCAAIESWQPGSYAAVLDGGASALWSGCAARHAAAVGALAVMAASPIGCAAAANSHTLPRCLEMLAACDGCLGTAGSDTADHPPPLLGLAVLRTLSRVVAGAREASVPLALGGGIPLLQRLGASQHSCSANQHLRPVGWEARSLVGLEAERLLFQMSTHPELTWPCLKHRVLTAAVETLLRTPTAFSPPRSHARVGQAPDAAGGEGTAGAVRPRQRYRDVSRPSCDVKHPSLPPVDLPGAHASPPLSNNTGAEPISCGCWHELRSVEAAVRRAAMAAARALVSPPQALLPLLAHNEVYAALALLYAASESAESSTSTAAEAERRPSPFRQPGMRPGGRVGNTNGGCTCEGLGEDSGNPPCAEAERHVDASRMAADAASHVEARLRDHCARQAWLLHSRLEGAVGLGVRRSAGAWQGGVAESGDALPTSSPWRASGGEMRTTSAERCPPDRLLPPQLQAALMLVRFPPSDDAAGIRAFLPLARSASGIPHAALLPALRSALLRHLLTPPPLLRESTRPGAAAGFATGCSAAACTLAGGRGCSPPAADSAPPRAAEIEREERVACASVLRHALMQRTRSMGAEAPLALRAAAAVVAAVGNHGVPDAYARALVESQVGLSLEGGF
jgi:hypothetical protein